MATSFGLYRVTHQGSLPQNWNELATVCEIERMNKGLAQAGLPIIQDRYEFVSRDLPYIDDDEVSYQKGSRVLMIRIVPMAEHGSDKQYRYVIYQRSDGAVGSNNMSEPRFQEMLRRANLALPQKPGLPLVEYEGVDPSASSRVRPNPYDGKGAPSPNLKNSGIPPTPSIRASTHTTSSPSKTTPVPVTTGIEGSGLPGAWLVGGMVAVGLLVLLVLGYRGFRK